MYIFKKLYKFEKNKDKSIPTHNLFELFKMKDKEKHL